MDRPQGPIFHQSIWNTLNSETAYEQEALAPARKKERS